MNYVEYGEQRGVTDSRGKEGPSRRLFPSPKRPESQSWGDLSTRTDLPPSQVSHAQKTSTEYVTQRHGKRTPQVNINSLTALHSYLRRNKLGSLPSSMAAQSTRYHLASEAKFVVLETNSCSLLNVI